MKQLLTLFAVIPLITAFLYPLYWGGLGNRVSWLAVAVMVVVGVSCFYLLVKYRKKL